MSHCDFYCCSASRGQAALQEKEVQSEVLRLAIEKQDGVALQEVAWSWSFDLGSWGSGTPEQEYSRGWVAQKC